MIFNGRGLKLSNLPEHQFYIGGNNIEVVDKYQYLGTNLKPSGSKASRAWYAIENALYKHKRLQVSRAVQLFDSLIKPIALYSCEFWLHNILSKKASILKNRSKNHGIIYTLKF